MSSEVDLRLGYLKYIKAIPDAKVKSDAIVAKTLACIVYYVRTKQEALDATLDRKP